MIGAFLTFAVAIFLALLPGCATPTTYGDGAPMRAPVMEPRPGYAPAGAGLPEYWGSPEPEARPRSPHKRVLPPQAGPGIWAGDEPRASLPPEPQFEGVTLPYPPETKTLEDAHIVLMCSRMLPHGMRASGVYPIWDKWQGQQRACLVAAYFDSCVRVVTDELKRAMGGVSHRSHQPTRDTARRFRDAACTGDVVTPELGRALIVDPGAWDIRRANP